MSLLLSPAAAVVVPCHFLRHRTGKPATVLQRPPPQLLLWTTRLNTQQRHHNLSTLVAAASSSAAPGYGSQFPEPSLGTRKQKRRIAGIDQDELVDPRVLADPDSCFCEFEGVHIHHKICDAEGEAQSVVNGVASSDVPTERRKVSYPLILLHGFGASVFSWDAVMKPLARVSGSKVLSFDRPAFGLTSRVDPYKHSSFGSNDARPLNPYSIAFSVLATLYFIGILAAEKAILVGHSAGCLVAVETYLQAPERVAAMILVAPAIVAPLTSSKIIKKDDQSEKEESDLENHQNPFIRLLSSLSKFSRYVVEAVFNVFRGMVGMLSSLYKRALSAFLRSSLAVMLVRMVIDKFGISAIRNAWYDANQITDSILQNYTRPLRTKGWDRALVDYTAAMLIDNVPGSKPPLEKRLGEISCPVLIVTGDSDRLVPLWNSERLARAIPGSHLEVIEKCGHLPQEERPLEFVSIVDKFLKNIFGGVEVECVQTAT